MATERDSRWRIQRTVFFFLGGGELWQRGPNLPSFSIYSTVLGHFSLKSLNTDAILFYFYFLYLFSRWGEQIGHFMALGRTMALNAPWIRHWRFIDKIFCLTIFLKIWQ